MQALAQLHDQRDVVVDDQEAEVFGLRQGGEQGEQALRLGLVHAGGGLVEQKEGRRRRERAGDLDAALVAIAEAAGEVVGAAGEAELGEQPVGEPACRRPPEALRDRARLDVLAHAQMAEQAHDLEGAGDAARGDLARRQAGDVGAVAQHAAVLRCYLPGDDVDQRRLAGAVGADQPQDLAGLEAQRHAIERAQAGELDRDLQGFEGRYGHRRSAGEALGRRGGATRHRPRLPLAQGAGGFSGVRQPRKLGVPSSSAMITAALSGAWPSSAER